MAGADAMTLITAYARLGINLWKAADSATKQRARNVFGNYLEDNDIKAKFALRSLMDGKEGALFIPMPKIGHHGIERCYFALRSKGDRLSYDLLLFCEAERYLGFRFDPPEEGTHAYAQIQMNRAMLHGDLRVRGLPVWLPDSYPAFPLCTSNSLEMFFSLITCVHGYPKEMSEVLQLALQSEPGLRKEYWDGLTRYLAGEPRHR